MLRLICVFAVMGIALPCLAFQSTFAMSGRHVVIPNPLTVSSTALPSHAIAFDFNGFLFNLTVQTQSSWEVLSKIDIVLSTVCYPINSTSVSTTGRKGQRFGLFVNGLPLPAD